MAVSTRKERWARATKQSINHEAEILLGMGVRGRVLHWPKEQRGRGRAGGRGHH